MKLRLYALSIKALTLSSKLGLTFLIAGSFSPADAGVFGLYAAALLLSIVIMGLDVYASSIRELLSAPERSLEIISKHLGFMILAVFPLGFLAALLYQWQSQASILLVSLFCMHLAVEFFSQEGGRALVALRHPLWAEIVLFIRGAVWIPVAAIGIVQSPDAEPLIILLGSWFGASVAAAIVTALLTRRVLGAVAVRPIYDISWVKLALLSSVWLFIGTLFFRSIFGLDKFLVNDELGLEMVGVYTVQASLGIALLSLVEASVSSWRYPSLVASLQKGERNLAKKELNLFIVEVFSVIAVISVLAYFFVPLILSWFARPEYVEDFSVFYWVMAGVSVYCLSIPFHYVMYGLKKDKFVLLSHASGALFLVICASPLMGQYHLAGAGMMLFVALVAVACSRVLIGGMAWRHWISVSGCR